MTEQSFSYEVHTHASSAGQAAPLTVEGYETSVDFLVAHISPVSGDGVWALSHGPSGCYLMLGLPSLAKVCEAVDLIALNCDIEELRAVQPSAARSELDEAARRCLDVLESVRDEVCAGAVVAKYKGERR